MSRLKWGLGGLLAFEAILVAYLVAFGSSSFAALSAGAAVVLGLAIWRAPTRAHYAALAAIALARAWLQLGGGAPLGLYPTLLVPLGFAWLAAVPAFLPRFAVAAIALARTWFVVWYLLPGNTTLVVANVLGAAGAWLWASDDGAAGSASLNEAPRVAPP